MYLHYANYYNSIETFNISTIRYGFHFSTLKHICAPSSNTENFYLKATPNHTKKKQTITPHHWKIIKINWPSLNKINFEYSSYSQECLLLISRQFFMLPLVKFFPSVNFPPTCSSSNSLYKSIWLVIMFVISLFVPPNMATPRTESTRETYGTFPNSFHP